MLYEGETVRAIRALRLLRDYSAQSGGLRGDEYDQIIRKAMPRRTSSLNWPAELMLILVRAQLIRVRRADREELMSADEFEYAVREFNLKSFVFSIPPHFDELCRVLGVTSLSELEKRANPRSVSVTPSFEPTRRTGLLKRDVFVLMPFGLALHVVYDKAIRPAVESLDLTVGRADNLYNRQDVMPTIWGAIYTADIVIADCTGRNADVFYELGLAHTIGRPTIILAQDLEDIPYSLRQFRCIVYEASKKGLAALGQEVQYAIQQIRRTLREY